MDNAVNIHLLKSMNWAGDNLLGMFTKQLIDY